MPSAQVSVIVCGPTLYTIANFGRSTRMVKIARIGIAAGVRSQRRVRCFVVPRTKVEPDGGVETYSDVGVAIVRCNKPTT
jgi:ribosomal protein S27E